MALEADELIADWTLKIDLIRALSGRHTRTFLLGAVTSEFVEFNAAAIELKLVGLLTLFEFF